MTVLYPKYFKGMYVRSKSMPSRKSLWEFIQVNPSSPPNDGGGTVIAKGKPEEIIKNKKSYTGIYLADKLEVKKKAISKSRKS